MPPGPISYSLLPEGDRVLVRAPKGGAWSWYTMSLKGSPSLKLWEPKCEIGSDPPSFSPDDSRIVFTRNPGESARVVVANRDGSQTRIDFLPTEPCNRHSCS